MKKKPPKITGRAAFDERGSATWEFLSETGKFRREIDPERLKALGGGLSIQDQTNPKAPPLDPYNNVTPKADHGPSKGKRRSLDDMRRLSGEIRARKSAGQLARVHDGKNK